jgi:hypothetical protein
MFRIRLSPEHRMATILDVISELREVDPPLPVMLRNEPLSQGRFPEFQIMRWNGIGRVVPSEAVNLPGRTCQRSFMYRGQIQRFAVCKASLVRDANGDMKRLKALSVLEHVRVAELELILRSHPFKKVADRFGFDVDYHALAQHYGIKTHLLDLTSNVEVAAFFAVARWNSCLGRFVPMKEGTGVMYRLDWASFGQGYSKAFDPIGFGPGLRPARQHAWTFELHPSVDFEQVPYVKAFEFEHKKVASLELFKRFKNGRHLYPPDCMASLVERIGRLPFVTMAAIRQAALKNGVSADEVENFCQHTAMMLQEALDIPSLRDYSLQLNTKDTVTARRQAKKLQKRLAELRVGLMLVPTRASHETGR